MGCRTLAAIAMTDDVRDAVEAACLWLGYDAVIPLVVAASLEVGGYVREAEALRRCEHHFDFPDGEARWTILVRPGLAAEYGNAFDRLADAIAASAPAISEALSHLAVVVELDAPVQIERLERLWGEASQLELFEATADAHELSARLSGGVSAKGRDRAADLELVENIPVGRFITWPEIVVACNPDDSPLYETNGPEAMAMEAFMQRFGRQWKRTCQIFRPAGAYLQRSDPRYTGSQWCVRSITYGPGVEPAMHGEIDSSFDLLAAAVLESAADVVAFLQKTIRVDARDGEFLKIRLT